MTPAERILRELRSQEEQLRHEIAYCTPYGGVGIEVPHAVDKADVERAFTAVRAAADLCPRCCGGPGDCACPSLASARARAA